MTIIKFTCCQDAALWLERNFKLMKNKYFRLFIESETVEMGYGDMAIYYHITIIISPSIEWSIVDDNLYVYSKFDSQFKIEDLHRFTNFVIERVN